jgi:putative oxidoreductase
MHEKIQAIPQRGVIMEAETVTATPTAISENLLPETETSAAQSTSTVTLAESLQQLSQVLSQIRSQIMSQRVISEVATVSMVPVAVLRKSAVPLLTTSLSVVYIWFGLLKVAGMSPVLPLIQGTYPQFPEPLFIHTLGVAEVIIGLLILNRRTQGIAIVALWIHMGGIFSGLIIQPGLYFTGGNVLELGMYGEFVIKNIVLISGSLVVLMHQRKE